MVGSSSLGLTSFAIAEDIHALAVVFLDVLFNGVLTERRSDGVGERLANLMVDVFTGNARELRNYCAEEPGWEDVVQLLDEKKGWDMLGMMIFARERAMKLANDKGRIGVLTCEGVLGGAEFFSGVIRE